MALWWIFHAKNKSHRNTRPPIRPTTAPTTITVMVVVLENFDVDVCEGVGVAAVAVLSEAEVVVRPNSGSVVEPGVVNVGTAVGEVVVGVAPDEVTALWVKAVELQPSKTVEPPSNRYSPTLGVNDGLFR